MSGAYSLRLVVVFNLNTTTICNVSASDKM